jgi:hypothetical protein
VLVTKGYNPINKEITKRNTPFITGDKRVVRKKVVKRISITTRLKRIVTDAV